MKPDMCPADQLEPEVRAMAAGLQVLLEGGGRVDAVSAVAPAIYSVAISLKRIADVASGPGCVSGFIEDIAFNAGRAFENGRRQG